MCKPCIRSAKHVQIGVRNGIDCKLMSEMEKKDEVQTVHELENAHTYVIIQIVQHTSKKEVCNYVYELGHANQAVYVSMTDARLPSYTRGNKGSINCVACRRQLLICGSLASYPPPLQTPHRGCCWDKKSSGSCIVLHEMRGQGMNLERSVCSHFCNSTAFNTACKQ